MHRVSARYRVGGVRPFAEYAGRVIGELQMGALVEQPKLLRDLPDRLPDDELLTRLQRSSAPPLPRN